MPAGVVVQALVPVSFEPSQSLVGGLARDAGCKGSPAHRPALLSDPITKQLPAGNAEARIWMRHEEPA